MTMNAAAIDLGTNSIKLLIVRRDKEGHMQVLFRHRSVVRLGEGTYGKKSGGKIPRFVQLRTLKVFQTYAQFLDAYKVDVVRATGTSALRDAVNGPEFVKEVRMKTGIALEILPGEEEARLIVKGVASEWPLPRKPCLFVDIGGGSCEISLVKGKKVEKFAKPPARRVRFRHRTSYIHSQRETRCVPFAAIGSTRQKSLEGILAKSRVGQNRIRQRRNDPIARPFDQQN